MHDDLLVFELLLHMIRGHTICDNCPFEVKFDVFDHLVAAGVVDHEFEHGFAVLNGDRIQQLALDLSAALAQDPKWTSSDFAFLLDGDWGLRGRVDCSQVEDLLVLDDKLPRRLRRPRTYQTHKQRCKFVAHLEHAHHFTSIEERRRQIVRQWDGKRHLDLAVDL